MNEWWFIGIALSVSVLVGAALLQPLRQNRLLSALIGVVLVGLVIIAYGSWGSFTLWQDYLQRNTANEVAKNMLKSIKSPQELVEKLKAKLDDSPGSAKGWYLLGRLYSSQNEFKLAVEAFAKAHRLVPANEQYTVNYGQGLWQLNHQQFNDEIIEVFHTLLINNPNQPDALAMLAMSAYMKKQYNEAIGYWQKLLVLAPEGSDDAVAIRKAIAKAQNPRSLE